MKPPLKAVPSQKPIKPKGKAGRPPSIPATEETRYTLKQLASIGCTTREVAAFLDVNEDTLHSFWKRYPDFKLAFTRGLENFKIGIRRNQYELSKTNAAVAIFLGKNYCGQTDKFNHGHEFDFTGLTDEEIQIVMKGLARKAADNYAVKQADQDAPSPTVQ